ncbi:MULTISPECIES: monovalent cation/H+ antiporter complex subunit F [Micrococcus]|uniref:monovalent cation/H+ antiporter complex subunit F n=1 Tax=Micrococcus TaxID=1269 RepID=UPI001CCD386F|nr:MULTISPECIES: monovalent cation/H+ antiporter complex subunit F [Micrococcus]MCG7421374.1 monovalent cation/H+ antiporter complex subunit F [Micrococcus sp. ACRRV]UBH23934.1 pesticidal protein Cry26Aa [Micrococcus porci]
MSGLLQDYDWSLAGIDLAIALLLVAALVSAVRILRGPLDADRAVSGDLLTFSVLGMVVMFGVRAQNPFTFDLVLVAAIVAFLSGMSLARALTRGKR